MTPNLSSLWSDWGGALVDLVFPRCCTVCRRPLMRGEQVMCLGCSLELPVTDMHLHPSDNELTTRLASLHAPVERATALYHYVAGTPYVGLVHDTKYNRRPSVGRQLARMHALEIAPSGFWEGVDLLLPLPLHFSRRMVRGYNQSAAIAEGLSQATGIPVWDNLVALRPHSTQTRKGAARRRMIPEGIYAVRHPERVAGLHAVVVDDVVTTGSTMLAALHALHRASPSTRISVYALAMATIG